MAATDTAWTTGGVKDAFYGIIREQPAYKDLLKKHPNFALMDADYLVERTDRGIVSRLKFDSLEVVDIVIAVEEDLGIKVLDEDAEAMVGITIGVIAGQICEIMIRDGITVEGELDLSDEPPPPLVDEAAESVVESAA